MSDVVGFEKSLIGTVVKDQASFEIAYDITPSDFGVIQHQIIWKTIQDLAPRGVLTDRSLIETMRSNGTLESLGGEKTRGEEYIYELINLADSIATEEFVDQIKDASIKRRIGIIGVGLVNASKNGKPATVIIEDHVKNILQIQIEGIRDPKIIAASAEEQQEKIQKKRSGEIEECVWKPDIVALKKLIPGLQPADFMIIPGRPGDGKSSLLRYFSIKAALDNKKVLFLTNENTFEECQTWAVSQLTGIDHLKILYPKKLTDSELKKVKDGFDQLKSLPIHVEELFGAPLDVVTATARRMKMKLGLDIILLDGMYLMGGTSENRYETISDNSQGLRSLAQELKTPIISTTQFRRGSESKRELTQHDLLYAGENPARIIMAIVKKEMTPFEIAQFPENKDENGKPLLSDNLKAVKINFKVMKNTNGNIGTSLEVKWLKYCNQYVTLTREVPPPEIEEAQKFIPSPSTFTPAPKPVREKK